MDEIKAIGRGATAPMRRRYRSRGSVLGSSGSSERTRESPSGSSVGSPGFHSVFGDYNKLFIPNPSVCVLHFIQEEYCTHGRQ